MAQGILIKQNSYHIRHRRARENGRAPFGAGLFKGASPAIGGIFEPVGKKEREEASDLRCRSLRPLDSRSRTGR